MCVDMGEYEQFSDPIFVHCICSLDDKTDQYSHIDLIVVLEATNGLQ